MLPESASRRGARSRPWLELRRDLKAARRSGSDPSCAFGSTAWADGVLLGQEQVRRANSRQPCGPRFAIEPVMHPLFVEE